MTWGRLDDTFWRHRKLTGTSLAATGLQARALSYCNDQLNDGHLTPADLDRLTSEISGKARRKLAAELVTRNIWEEEGPGWYVHDYPIYNRSRAEVLAEREHLSKVRSEAGSKGAAKRWQGHSNSDGKPDGKPIAPVPYPNPVPKSKGQEQERATPARGRDSLFDAIAEWQGVPPGQSAPRALARTIGTAVADIRRADPDHATPEEARQRIANLPKEWDTPGPMALAAHWFSLEHRSVTGAGSRLLREALEEVNHRGENGSQGPARNAPRSLPSA